VEKEASYQKSMEVNKSQMETQILELKNKLEVQQQAIDSK